jgi:hypothetical protein
MFEAWDKGGILIEDGDLKLVDGLISCRLGHSQQSGLAGGESRNVGIDERVGVKAQDSSWTCFKCQVFS